MADTKVYIECVRCGSDDIYAPSVRYCRACHYADSAASKKRWVEKCREYVRQYKVSRGCQDCGGTYNYYQLDLDHVRGTKVKDISQMFGQVGIKKIKVELDKCEVVCRNCHAERTFKRAKDIFGV